jgi:hemoglobin
MLVSVGLLLTMAWPPALRTKASAEDKGTTKSVSPETLDERVYEALLKVHREAAGLYNEGNYTESAYLFRGALLAVQPFLDHQPSVKQAIAMGLKQADGKSSMALKAWRLYQVVADVEDWVSPRMPPPTADGTLWDRLTEKRVRKIVGEFVDDVVKHPDVNFSRGGKYKMTPSRINELKERMVELASEVMGGPLRYRGKPLALVHDGMNIKAEEFTTFVARLELKLMRYVKEEEDRMKVLKFVESTRNKIVAGNQAPKNENFRGNQTPKDKIPLPTTLWERLGGKKGARKIVDDLFLTALKDREVNFDRGGKYPMNAARVEDLKKKFVALISHYGGGPEKYEGKPLKDVHRLMGITDPEFDALLGHMKVAFVKNHVGSDDIDLMLDAVKGTRNDIVTDKKGAPAAAPARDGPAGRGNTGNRKEPATNKPGVASDQAAKAVLDRAIRAMGGEEKLTKALKGCTWKTKGTLIYEGRPNPISTESTLAGLDKYRAMFKVELAGNEIEGVGVLNGDKGYHGLAGMDMDFDLANEKRVAYLSAISALIVPLKANGFKCESAGEERVDNKTAVVLKVIGPDGKDSKLYLDKQTDLPIKQVARVINLMGQEVTQETLFSKYKQMGGIQKAAKTIIEHDGQKVLELETTEFKILEKVDPKIFEKP